MKTRILLTLILMLTASEAFAQMKVFKWGNDLCAFQSTYNARKYTVRQLEDTRKLLYLDFFPSTIDPTPPKIADIKNLRVETLDAEYKKRTDELKNLNIVKTAYWEALRRKHLRELEQVYQLSRASILGYENPARLKDVKFAGACVQKYAEPLINGDDDLLVAWLSVNEDSRERNVSPERVKRIYEQEYNSPERMQYARNEVMTYGWWNCVNALIDRDQDENRHEKEFRKLFVKTKEIDCDEP